MASRVQAAKSLTFTQAIDLLEADVLRTLPLETRVRLASRQEGMHQSRASGSGTQFRDHRPYVPGDDIRRIDWRLYARTEREYLRLYERPTILRVTVCIDDSGSMDYGNGETNKLLTARVLAWAVAKKAAEQADRLRLISASDAVDAATFLAAQGALENLSCDADMMDGLAALTHKLLSSSVPDIVVLITDAWDESAVEALQSLAVMAAQGCDTRLIQLVHQDELDLPFTGVIQFDDAEGRKSPITDPKLAFSGYRGALGAHLAQIEQTSKNAGIHYVRSTTTGALSDLVRFALTGEVSQELGRDNNMRLPAGGS